MRISVIGSCTGVDFINKHMSSEGYCKASDIVSYTPATLMNDFGVGIKARWIPGERANISERIRNEFSGRSFLLNNIKRAKPDFIFADLSDLRLPVRILELENGKHIYLSATQWLPDTKSRIYSALCKMKMSVKADYVKHPADFTDEELENYTEGFINFLFKHFDKSKIFFIKPKLAVQCLERGSFIYVPNYKISVSTNPLLDKIYKIAEKYISFVNAPENIIGDAECFSPFEYHFTGEYYSYLNDCFKHFVNTGKQDTAFLKDALRSCEMKIEKKIGAVFSRQLVDRIRLRADSDVVLVAPTRQLADMLKEDCGRDIAEYIEYNSASDMDKIEQSIRECLRKNPDVIFAVPESFNHGEGRSLCLAFYKNHVPAKNQFFYSTPTVILDKFTGRLCDCYHNDIDVLSPTRISLRGMGNVIKMQRQKEPPVIVLNGTANIYAGAMNKLSATVFMGEGATLIIGSNNTMAAHSELAVHFLSKLKIGDDMMTSFYVMIYTSDGHPMFIKNEHGGYVRKNVPYEEYVEIGDHVWIGYSARIIAGSKIGAGSIVGANSICNKRYPNNVCIAGAPARILRRNVAWSRNIMISELEHDANVYENYARDTVDE